MMHLDRAVYNVLVSKFAAGLFEHPYTDESRVKSLDNSYNRKLALEAAEQGVVLLKNADGILPLDFKKMEKKGVALIGPLADDAVNQCGSYYNAGANVVTIKAALEAELKSLSPPIAMTYSRGAETDSRKNTMIDAAVAAAAAADVAIVVVGDSTNTCTDKCYFGTPIFPIAGVGAI